MKRFLGPLILSAIVFAAAPAGAQTIGTFRWNLAPLGSVLNLTVTQQGSIFLIQGTEEQCGDNLSLPVTGLAVPQANGQIFIGVTSINENGQGLHTRAYITPANLNGSWADNTGYYNQSFVFNPGTTCPGGLRTGPTSDVVPK